jgi:hypothetical protein
VAEGAPGRQQGARHRRRGIDDAVRTFTEFSTISVAAASRGATICAVDEINKVGLGQQRGQEPVYGRGWVRRL